MRPTRAISLLFPLLILLTTACSVSKYIPEGEQFYAGVKKLHYEDEDKSTNGRLARNDLERVLLYKPNNSLLGSASTRLPVTYPFYINTHYAEGKNFLERWLYKTFGAKPILISSVNPSFRASIGRQILEEYGYFRSDITPRVEPSSKDSVQAKVSYNVVMGAPYLYDSIRYMVPIQPESLPDLYSTEESLIKSGEPFSVVSLQNERNRISKLLRDEGYYFFRPENIVYQADTVQVPQRVQLRVKLSEGMLPEAYEPWHIGEITYNLRDAENGPLTDSLYHEGILYRYHRRSPVRIPVLANRIRIERGELYGEQMESRTLNRMAELDAFAYTDVSYTPRVGEDGVNYLDVLMTSRLAPPYFTELEGTFKLKSNNQVGPGASFSVNRKNIFHGGELLSILLRGSYEWETQRSSSKVDKWDINSYELGVQASLTFPRLLIPFLSSSSINFPVSTSMALSGVILNRTNFYRQGQFTYDLSYHLEPNKRVRHTITPLSISYNHIIKSSERFDTAMEENPALALSFRNQFVPQLSYLFGYQYQDPLRPHGFSLEAYVSEAGNLTSLLSWKSREKGEAPSFIKGVPFAQFVKGTLELRYNYRFTPRLQVATRAYAGAIYSYSEMRVPPYKEQFYSGGANSIRGFNVRTLGPGSYRPVVSGPMDFLDRTGDVRFEGNLELRYRVIGQLELATFVDAGNVWLLNPDETRPDGELSAEYFWKDLALGTGLGVRYDLNYLVLRFDVGLGLHSPSRLEEEPYFNTFGDGWPLAFHLSIGYPF
ncbi:MAG: BamA/TamA family outer membrane protein [Porphyromonas sp.]|nr:BamA/TamA family outer membrane protein [Porphyromonas sp.]